MLRAELTDGPGEGAVPLRVPAHPAQVGDPAPLIRPLGPLPRLGDPPGPQEPPEAVEHLQIHGVDLLPQRPRAHGPPEPPCALLPGLRDVGPLVVPDPPRGVLRLVLEPPRKAPERGDHLGRAPGPPLLGR